MNTALLMVATMTCGQCPPPVVYGPPVIYCEPAPIIYCQPQQTYTAPAPRPTTYKKRIWAENNSEYVISQTKVYDSFECYIHYPTGWKKVPIVNGYAPQIGREYDSARGWIDVYDYTEKISYLMVKRSESSPSLTKLPPRVTETREPAPKMPRAAIEESSSFDEPKPSIRKQEPKLPMPRVEEDPPPAKKIEPPKKVDPPPTAEPPRLDPAPPGMRRPSEVDEDKDKKKPPKGE